MNKHIKKITLILLCVCIGAFSACSTGTKMNIEEHTWDFSHIQGNKNGEIIYCSDKNTSLYADAEILDLSCTAESGIITITDNANAKSWKINYSVNNTLGESTIYDISVDGISGNASVSKTTYDDGSFEYTFIISIDGYAIYFTD